MGSKSKAALILAAVISSVTALAHMSCIILGTSCYKAQLAPPEMIQSSIDGTLLAPLVTLFISALFLTCALFAVSGAGLIKKLPLQNIALIVIAVLCLLRGMATIPLSYIFPEMVSTFSILAGFVWFISGCLFFYGYYSVRRVSAI